VSSPALNTPAQVGTDGWLNLSVELGPSHLIQQYDFGLTATFGWESVTVRIEPS
jgi:hypothetical protein